MALICYPLESSFYPWHLITSLITTLLFAFIIFSYRIFIKRTSQHRGKQTREGTAVSLADSVALMTLILGVIVTGLLPVIQSPLIDYSADLSSNNTALEIDVSNLGLAAANHVIVSVVADNVDFYESREEPFLANHFKVNNSTSGNIFFEIDVMPPRSGISITTDLSGANTGKGEVIPYVRSDERVGFHLTLITSVFYFLLGSAYVFAFVYLVYWDRIKHSEKWKHLGDRSSKQIILFVVIIFVGELIGTFVITGLHQTGCPEAIGSFLPLLSIG